MYIECLEHGLRHYRAQKINWILFFQLYGHTTIINFTITVTAHPFSLYLPVSLGYDLGFPPNYIYIVLSL